MPAEGKEMYEFSLTLSMFLFHPHWICYVFTQIKLSRILLSVVLYFIPSGFVLQILPLVVLYFIPSGFVPCFLRENFHGF
jgi:hypothetical protein